MDVGGWCASQGYASAWPSGDAGSWSCYNADGSYGRSIDVDPVCVFSSSGSHPYAGLTNMSDPYSWYCATTPQGRPSTDENPENDSVQPTQVPATGGSNSTTCSFAPLSAGDRGQVTAGIANRLRSGPSTSYSQIGSLPPYTQILVLSGPYAANSYCWYEVRLADGTIGYTAAGTLNDPWLVRFDLSTMNVSPTGQNEPQTNPLLPEVIDGYVFMTCVVDGLNAYMLDRYAGNDLGFLLDGIITAPVGAASAAIERILQWWGTSMTVVEFFRHHPQVLILKYYVSNSDGNTYVTIEEQGDESTLRAFTTRYDDIPRHGGSCQGTPV